MMTFVLIIHTLVCVLLVLSVLMQAGRGGGLTEQFASAENVFGAQTNQLMVRVSSVLATIFFITCLSLAYMSARQERSLVADHPVKSAPKLTIPPMPAEKSMSPTATPAPAADVQAPVAVAPAAAEPAPSSDAQTPVATNAQ